MTAAERIEAAGRWLASAGGTAAPGEVGAALGLNHARQAETVRALRDAGLCEGPKGQLKLTPAGWARFGVTDPGDGGATLGEALDGWPHAHRAFASLLVSTAVARRHLAAARLSRWPGFMAIGETGSGKSSAVEVAVTLLGLDLARVRVFLSGQTAGTLLGRREQTPDGWQFAPAPLTRGPLAFFDEYDKADDPTRRAALPYFQGEARVMAEDQVLDLAPVPVLAANPPARGDRYAVLRPEYRRRSVVLDTRYMRGRGEVFEELMSRPRGRVLDLDRLAPPASRLDEDGRAVLKQVRQVLTEAGAEEFPGVEALELAALGRLPLLDTPDHTRAAFLTALDYLLVTETVPGQVIDGWQPDIAALRQAFGSDAGTMTAALDQARAEREQARGQARQARVRHDVEDLGLVRDRHALAEQLRQAAESIDGRRVPATLRPEAAGVRAALRDVRTRVLDTRARTRLDDLAAVAAEPLAQAEAIVRQVQAEQQQALAERQQAEADRRQAKHAQAEHRRLLRAQRVALAEQLETCLSEARELERLYVRTATREGESPFAVLRDYRVSGQHPLLRYVAPPQRPRPTGLLATVRAGLAGPEHGHWEATTAALRLPGTPYSCPLLAEWGPYSRAVLAPVLRELHAHEDQLRAALGRKRRSRPAVALTEPTPAPVPLLPAASPRRALSAR